MVYSKHVMQNWSVFLLSGVVLCTMSFVKKQTDNILYMKSAKTKKKSKKVDLVKSKAENISCHVVKGDDI